MNRRPLVLAAFVLVAAAAPARPEEAPVPKARPSIPAFFNGFDKHHPELLDEFYAADVEFHDTVSDLRGLAALKTYYAKLYENLISIRFDFGAIVESGDEAFAPWTMRMRHKAVNGGREIALEGVSHIRFRNGKAVYHRDYFDMGAFVYEHVPVLGAGVRYVKKKVAGH